MCKIGDIVVFLLLALCSLSDLRKRTIPIYLLIVLSVTVAVSALLCDGPRIRLRLGGALIGVLFFLVSKFSQEAIGYGDSWLILLLGIHLGSVRAMGILFTASLIAAVGSLFLLWRSKWRRNATLPFVPFLTISYLGVFFR